jgi:hypothetical protein
MSRCYITSPTILKFTIRTNSPWLGETYTFRKIDNGWKIVTATVHDPDVVLRLK